MAELPAGEQFADGHLESPRQPPDDQQPGIALSILNAGEVGHVDASRVGQFLLGEPARLAQLPDSLAKRRSKVGHGSACCREAVDVTIDDRLISRSSGILQVSHFTLTDLVECPLCSGRGTIAGRRWRRGLTPPYRCPLCDGDGAVIRQDVRDLQRLRAQMQRVADAMQAGDADRAADACRTAARLAHPLLRKHG